MSDFAEGMRVQSQLEDANQAHLIKFYDELDAEGKAQLEADLIDLEIDQLDHMFKGELRKKFKLCVNFVQPPKCTNRQMPTRSSKLSRLGPAIRPRPTLLSGRVWRMT